MSKKLWSDHKKLKSLTEGWRGFLAEEENSSAAASGVDAEDLMNMSLSSFIQNVQSTDNQKAILGGLGDGSESDDQFEIVPTAIPVKNLRPTQNEVVLNKSIPFNLFNKPKQFLEFRASDGPFAVGPPGNDAIITFNGEYVIDGHHRWSSLYCVNPNASIQAFDIRKPGEDPKDVLKAVQAAILSKKGSIPQNKGGGTNLFTIDAGTFKKWLVASFKKHPEAMEFFAKAIKRGTLKEKRGNYIHGPTKGAKQARRNVISKLYNILWSNIESLKQNNKPIDGATKRLMMPQADKVGAIGHSSGTPAALEPLQKGVINTEKPFSKVASESRKLTKSEK